MQISYWLNICLEDAELSNFSYRVAATLQNNSLLRRFKLVDRPEYNENNRHELHAQLYLLNTLYSRCNLLS